MSERQWLITASARPGDEPFNGSVIRWCSICGCDIWLSPVAIVRMARESLQPICLECGVPMMAEHDQVIGNAVDPSAPESTAIIRLMQKTIREAREARKRNA